MLTDSDIKEFADLYLNEVGVSLGDFASKETAGEFYDLMKMIFENSYRRHENEDTHCLHKILE